MELEANLSSDATSASTNLALAAARSMVAVLPSRLVVCDIHEQRLILRAGAFGGLPGSLLMPTSIADPAEMHASTERYRILAEGRTFACLSLKDVWNGR